MNEERTIKVLLIIFTATYVFRVVTTVIMYIYRDWVVHLFNYNHTLFIVSMACLWLSWDSLPLISMLVTHYKNF